MSYENGMATLNLEMTSRVARTEGGFSAERMVRQAVLWRKGSFGTQSRRGARYAERMLSVCATCRLQGRSVIEYLRHVCRCHLDGLPVPSLIPAAINLAKTA